MPVSLVDAKRFQRVVLWLTFVPLVGIGVWIYYSTEGFHLWPSGIHGITNRDAYSITHPPANGASSTRTLGWIMEGIGLAFAAICLWLFLKAVTGVASYFFHPRGLAVSRQNRAIALSYYACAPLAWTPVSIVILIAMVFFSSSDLSGTLVSYRIGLALGGLVFVSVGIQLTAWWRCSLALLKSTTRCSGARIMTLGISLPFIWGLCAVLALGVLPLAYVVVCVVILSIK
jgi:hypothetical protein